MDCRAERTDDMKALLDVHTHSIASGHAYGTVTEMAKAASEIGLKLLGITEHAKGIPGTCDNFYFTNLGALPREMFGVEMMFGSEINIIDYEGHLSLEQKFIDCLDIRIAGMHRFCYRHGNIEQNTSAVIGAINNPDIDIISHPDDDRTPLDYERVCRAAKEFDVLLEINNSSLKAKNRINVFQNCCRMLEICKKIDHPIIMNSDAHFMNAIANFDQCQKVLEAVDFPDRLVINYDLDRFKEFIANNRAKKG